MQQSKKAVLTLVDWLRYLQVLAVRCWRRLLERAYGPIARLRLEQSHLEAPWLS